MLKNTSGQKLTVYAFDSTTNLPKTGDATNITAYVNKDYAGLAALTDTSATEVDATNAKGFYIFDLTQAETNADILAFSGKSSTANIVVIPMPAVVFTRPANFTTLSVDGSGRVDVAKVAGTAQTAGDLKASLNTIAGYIDTEVADIQSRLPAALTGGGHMKVDVLALNGSTASAANLERSASAIRRGAVTGATTTTTLIDSSLTESATDHWKGRIVIFTSGTLAGQATDITAFDPATDKLTFSALTGAPSNGDAYVIV